METKLSVQVQLSDTPIVSKKNRMRYARGRVYKTAEVQDFEHALEKAAAEAICQITDWKPLSGPVKLELQMQFPDRRRRDLHNTLDTICDALQEIIYEDDAQVCEIVAKKTIGNKWDLQIVVSELE